MHGDHHGVFAIGIEGSGIEQPALDPETIAARVEALGLTPRRLAGPVFVSDLLPGADGAGPDFGRRLEGIANEGGDFAVTGHGEAAVFVERRYGFVSVPDSFKMACSGIEARDGAPTIFVLGEVELRRLTGPGE